MKQKIVIIDYGAGNLRSLSNALLFLGYENSLIRTPEEIQSADKMLLPGVGAFGFAMDNLRNLSLVEPILEKTRSGTPLLGICLGMQLLLSSSSELGEHIGLNLVAGRVDKLEVSLKVPHMGWNELQVKDDSQILKNLPASRFAYFVHSFHCMPEDNSAVSATTDYDGEFVSALEKDNLYGLQFHPEKSQELGLQILKNFAEI